MAEQDPQDDWALIDAFIAEPPRWTRWRSDDAETILDIGDLETRWVLAERGGRFTFETIQRGHRTTTASFASARDARRLLLLRLGQSWRSPRRLPDPVGREPAPGSSTTPVPSGHQLSWPGGTAFFERQYEAVKFSWVADAEPAAIAASLRDPRGRPLFDLTAEELAPPSPRPIPTLLPPRRPRRLPPDVGAAADLRVVEQAASELGWTRRAAVWPDVLAIGDDQMGRLVTQQRGAFAYQHDRSRTTIAYVTAPAAARRFMLLDLGEILRTRRRLPILRVHSTGPNTVLTKTATQFELTWPGGAATFRLGPVGQQRAQAFSWCVQARLEDIVASCRDGNGAPLFDLRREHRTRPPWHP